MHAIKTELQIKSVTLNKDDSVSFRAVTPELSDSDLSAFREVSKCLVNALLEPQKGSTQVLEIKEKIETGKSASSRLRSVIFIWWEQLGKEGDFEVFYRMKMEKIIDTIKGKLN
jgi:hypothetical protein